MYIGFDIGDGESIIELATSANDNVQPATMPGQNASGQSIPTLFAVDNKGNGIFADQVAADYEDIQRVEMNFKRCPGDMISVPEIRASELLQIEAEELLDEPEFQSGPIKDYADRLCAFVDIVLNDDKFKERARAFAANCEDCVICVGHPTNWTALDCHIYRAILLKSVIGEGVYLKLPMTLSLESESRAAFLYIKNTYLVKLKEGEVVGLMDVGSSTIDISVMTKNSRDCIYDSGSNYLGARSIDYLILNYYIEEIEKKNSEDAARLKDLLTNDETAFRSLLLNCRFAKEAVFSSALKDKSVIKTHIYFGDFNRVTLTWKVLVDDICAKRPIAPVLQKYCGMPEDLTKKLGNQSWITAFRAFLKVQLDIMKYRHGISITKLFLTGSASRMEFVRTICKEMIPGLDNADSLFDDTNPSNAIANGLARVGASEFKADAFMKDMTSFLDKERGELYAIIRRRIPDLIADIADPLVDVMQNQVFMPELQAWKNGRYSTLQEMMDSVGAICRDESKFNSLLSTDEDFSAAVESWVVNKVGHDIALELQNYAMKHGVHNFTVDQLNVFKALNLNLGDGLMKTTDINIISQLPADKIATAVAAVVAIAVYSIMPYVTTMLLWIISFFFEVLATEILAFLASLPGGVVIAGFGAIALLIAAGVTNGYKENKERINQWLLGQNLPGMVRKAIDISKISGQMKQTRGEMVSQMNAKMNEQDVVDKLGSSIYANIQQQVQERANQIRYEIESR